MKSLYLKNILYIIVSIPVISAITIPLYCLFNSSKSISRSQIIYNQPKFNLSVFHPPGIENCPNGLSKIQSYNWLLIQSQRQDEYWKAEEDKWFYRLLNATHEFNMIKVDSDLNHTLDLKTRIDDLLEKTNHKDIYKFAILTEYESRIIFKNLLQGIALDSYKGHKKDALLLSYFILKIQESDRLYKEAAKQHDFWSKNIAKYESYIRCDELLQK